VPPKGLLQANVHTNENPRDALENATEGENIRRFFYFDRRQNVIYSLDKPIDGFTFTKVDMGELRSKRPDIFGIVQCASGKQCSTKNYDTCKSAIQMLSPATEGLQDQIVRTLKSRGYPVIRVNFLNEGSGPGSMEVQYFTECDFIRHDIEENFPNLISKR
jgi:hypothetical protein